MKMTTMKICITLLSFWIIIQVAVASKAEEQLLTELFENYSTLARPVQNHSDVLDVYVAIVIRQIIEVVSKIIEVAWTDYHLQWNDTEYDGVESIRVPRSKIWTPDVILYNRVEQESTEGEDKWLIPVSSSGMCSQMPLTIVSARCSIDITWFPFDDQLCELAYESWSYPASMLNISIMAGGELSLLEENCEWEIKDVKNIRSLKYDPPNEFVSVVFKIHLSRKVLYYAVNLILPCALISFLTPLTFLIPVEAGDRIGLGITLLLAMSVYQIIILDKIPTSSDGIPLIGSYFIVLICMNAIALILMIAIVNLHQPTTKPMPRWAHTFIFKYLARLVRMTKPSEETKKENLVNPESPMSGDSTVMFKNRSVDFISTSVRPFDTFTDDVIPDPAGDVILEHNEKTQTVTLPLSQLLELLKQKNGDGDEKPVVIDDWKFTALVVERACVIFFGTFQIICSLTLALFIFKNVATSNY